MALLKPREILVTDSDIGTVNTVWVDQAQINVDGYNTLGVFVEFTQNDSTTNQVRFLVMYEDGSTEFISETAADYLKTLGDADINIYYEFPVTDTVKIVNIQTRAAVVGATEGTVTIAATRGYL